MKFSLLAALTRHRRKGLLLAGGAVPSYALSTFTASSWNFTGNGVATSTDTLTVYDSNGVLMAGAPVVFTDEDTFVDAATCTLETDAAEIATTSGTANIIGHVYNASGTPLPGIPAASLVLSSTGTGNTITAVDTVSDRNGRFRWTFSSTSAATKTLSLTACGLAITDTAQVIVSAAPSAAALVFANAWPATGTTSANVRGSTAPTPFPSRIGSSPTSLSVVAATTDSVDTGCPTTNVLRTDLVYIGGGVQNMQTDEVSIAPSLTPDLTTVMPSWTAPGDGESVWYRIYFRPVYPDVADPGALNNNNHPLEEQSGGGTNWSWTFGTTASGFNPRFQFWYTSGANIRFVLGGGSPIYLSRNAWYRLEWSLDRITSTSRSHRIRIYDASNTLLYTDADFVNEASPFQSLDGYSNTFNDINDVGYWQVGTNGPHVTGATQGASPAWYWAGAAISREDWCGPYNSGEAP